MTASEPSKAGTGRRNEGGATAPTQNAEHALQEECESVPASWSGAAPSAPGAWLA